MRAVVDHHVDRPGVEEQQCLQLTGTNSSIGLIALILNNHSDHATARTVHIIFNLFFAGPVAIARRPNPIPSRTRSLNASAPMVLRLKTRESRSLPGLPRTDHLQGPFFTETKTLRASRRVFACLAINAASRSGPQATVRPLETCGLEADLPAASLSPQIFTFLLRHQGKPGRALPSSFPEATVRQGTTAWGWLSPHASIAPEPQTPPQHSACPQANTPHPTSATSPRPPLPAPIAPWQEPALPIRWRSPFPATGFCAAMAACQATAGASTASAPCLLASERSEGRADGHKHQASQPDPKRRETPRPASPEPQANQTKQQTAENGVPEGSRTPDLRFRKPPLYPAELPGQKDKHL